jgi:hypothetical protein
MNNFIERGKLIKWIILLSTIVILGLFHLSFILCGESNVFPIFVWVIFGIGLLVAYGSNIRI